MVSSLCDVTKHRKLWGGKLYSGYDGIEIDVHIGTNNLDLRPLLKIIRILVQLSL